MNRKHLCQQDFVAHNGEIYFTGDKINSFEFCNLSFLERLNFEELLTV